MSGISAGRTAPSILGGLWGTQATHTSSCNALLVPAEYATVCHAQTSHWQAEHGELAGQHLASGGCRGVRLDPASRCPPHLWDMVNTSSGWVGARVGASGKSGDGDEDQTQRQTSGGVGGGFACAGSGTPPAPRRVHECIQTRAWATAHKAGALHTDCAEKHRAAPRVDLPILVVAIQRVGGGLAGAWRAVHVRVVHAQPAQVAPVCVARNAVHVCAVLRDTAKTATVRRSCSSRAHWTGATRARNKASGGP